MTDTARLLLLGQDHGEYGAVRSALLGSRSAAAISVGSDPTSPSHKYKTDPNIKNEDVLCVIEAEGWAGYAVADAHYGPESSHGILSRLHTTWGDSVPENLEDLGQMIADVISGGQQETTSETTLLVVVYHRSKQQGFGISFGDSSFTVLGPDRSGEPLNVHDNRYVAGGDDVSSRDGDQFEFATRPGELLVLHTDGIDGCHYRHPATSVQPSHLLAVARDAGHDPLKTAEGITRLALRGVDGNPGGQDNIAVTASTA